ncbi:hypothetical protein WG66_001692 [Moniliophthora roreri]|uniref:Fungal-type protein kinase domain-containing protein n=1 Tax=Moniliophthora roreri TaxID=221103 RepID=A0A0W0FRZ9_MONRR|nr:hypothetical protein WG66_001692 [Moniliophthora roreri]
MAPELPKEWANPTVFRLSEIFAALLSDSDSSSIAQDGRTLSQRGLFSKEEMNCGGIETLYNQVIQAYKEECGGKVGTLKITTRTLGDSGVTFTVFEPSFSPSEQRENGFGFMLEPQDDPDTESSRLSSSYRLCLIPCTRAHFSFAISLSGTLVRFLARSRGVVVSSEAFDLHENWTNLANVFIAINIILDYKAVETLTSIGEVEYLAPRARRRIVVDGAKRSILELEPKNMRTILVGLVGALKGHQGLYEARFLHGDINTNSIVFIKRPCAGCEHCPHPVEGIPVIMDIDEDLLSRKFAVQRGLEGLNAED